MKNPFEGSRKIVKNGVIAGVTALTMLSANASFGQGSTPDSDKIKSGQGSPEDHSHGGLNEKELVKALKGYESSPGIPFEILLQQWKGSHFKIAEAVGQTQSAAQLSAQAELRKAGHAFPSATLTKNLDNGNVSVIVVAVEK